jgi:hypothetical protein
MNFTVDFNEYNDDNKVCYHHCIRCLHRPIKVGQTGLGPGLVGLQAYFK